jgi:Protein of unknown function (DUF2971).
MYYKFRSSQRPEFTVDILENNRLFCSDWRDLNDPMEGTYDTLITGSSPNHLECVREIYSSKVRLRVCSLSETYKSHAMWAYYADEFRGAAIELKLPSYAVTRIDYASGLRIHKWQTDSNPYQIARKILTTKHSDWEAEKEVRVLHDQEFYELPPGAIQRVILGSRATSSFENAIRNAAGMVPVYRLSVRSGDLHASV